MNKLFPILALAISVSTGFSSTWAAGSCSIKEAPDPAVQEYLKGVDKVISEAMRVGSDSTCESPSGNRTATADVDKAQSSVVSSVNRSLSTSNVVTSFRYTVDLVTRSELPPGIRRDHSLLDQRQRKLIAAIDSLAASCASDKLFDTEISPFPTYVTKGQKVGDVMQSLLSNHTDVMNVYREAVLGEEPGSAPELTFAPASFIATVKKAYGPSALAACNTSGEGTFFEKMKQAIDRIGNIGDVMQNGTKDWKEAWSMLQGDHKNQDQLEKRLLRQEMGRQGMSTSSSERAVRNLDAYNRGEGWQGINGSVTGIGEAVNNGVAMAKGLYDQASDTAGQYASGFSKPVQPKPEDAKNTDDYLERFVNLAELKSDVAGEISRDYVQAAASLSDDTATADDNVGQLLEMHIILSKTLKSLAPYCETSRKACLDQAGNVPADCGSCN